MKTDTVLIVGGGFRSILAALGYATKGYSVTILHNEKQLGGFLAPIPWKNFWLDKGPQFFDNFTAEDKLILDKYIDSSILKNLNFKYSSYIEDEITEGFAIPDFRKFGSEFSVKGVSEILKNKNKNDNMSLFSFFTSSYGPELSEKLKAICQKIIREHPENLSKNVAPMVTFAGRNLLFDHEITSILKKDPFLDTCLAAKKTVVDSDKLNLYPLGSNLEIVRNAFENAIHENEISIINGEINTIDPIKRRIEINNVFENFDLVFLGLDCRISENILFKEKTLSCHTQLLPEVFHFFELNKKPKDESLYIMDYDVSHKTSRITNFYNYLGNKGKRVPVVCVEQPVRADEGLQTEPHRYKEKISEEICSLLKIDKKEIVDYQSFYIPVTYKLPKVGFERAEKRFRDKLNSKFGDYLLVPDSYTLTRKQTIDDLRELEVIH